MTEKERKHGKNIYRLQQMENKGTKIGQRKQHGTHKSVNKHYKKVNMGYSEKPEVIFRNLQPKV